MKKRNQEFGACSFLSSSIQEQEERSKKLGTISRIVHFRQRSLVQGSCCSGNWSCKTPRGCYSDVLTKGGEDKWRSNPFIHQKASSARVKNDSESRNYQISGRVYVHFLLPSNEILLSVQTTNEDLFTCFFNLLFYYFEAMVLEQARDDKQAPFL